MHIRSTAKEKQVTMCCAHLLFRVATLHSFPRVQRVGIEQIFAVMVNLTMKNREENSICY